MISALPPNMNQNLTVIIRGKIRSWAQVALLHTGQAPAAHHLRMLTMLEQVEQGKMRQLMLLLPPGSAKSTYASKIFPAWYLIRNPQHSVIMACHTAGLAESFGRSVRGLLTENGDHLDVRIRQDARAASRFSTEQGGEFFAIGVHGAVTGRRADLAIIDDPIKSFAEAESFSAREHLWEWFRSELVTRMKPRGRMVLVMTRWHSDDIAGRLLEKGGWAMLRLPALAESADMIGRAPGEALWPAWEDKAAIEEKRALLGERQFAALFQQAPMLESGTLFNARVMRVVDSVPDGVAVRGWDLAGTADSSGDPDWTAGVKLVRTADGAVFVDDVIRFRGAPAEVAERIRAVAAADGTKVSIGLPQDPGQAGKSQVMFLTQVLAGYRVSASPETGAKALRAMPVASQISNGAIAMRRARWNTDFLDELANFPHGRKDDQVDALARAFTMLLSVSGPARFVQNTLSAR